jgi:hypothetical protein
MNTHICVKVPSKKGVVLKAKTHENGIYVDSIMSIFSKTCGNK